MIWQQHPHETVLIYLDLGYIRKPHHCEMCWKRRIVVAHHEDYFKPVDVIWLCLSCHNKRHAEIGHAKHWKEINEMFPRSKTKRRKKYDDIISLSVDHHIYY